MNITKILLLFASASIAHSRPGETLEQIQERFGEPTMEHKNTPLARLNSVAPVTSSLRETTRVYLFGRINIFVHFLDNRSQREEYDAALGQAEIEKLLTASSNGAAWSVELQKPDHTKSVADAYSSREMVFQNKLPTFGIYKSSGLRAWMGQGGHGGSALIVETDAFRALRLSQPAKKPEFGGPIPGKGKGF